jgi:uncharacterized phiE125 gp8 family phage protein
MGLSLITPPDEEPVTLAEAKAHLRVDVDDDDALIARLISAARRAAESYTGRVFLAQSWRLSLDAWPENANRALEVPKPPLIAVTLVQSFDRNDAATTLDEESYLVDSTGVTARIVLRETTVLPSPLREANGIAVAFDAGYGSASDVPDAIKTAILSFVAHLYQSRGDGEVPPPFDALAQLAPYRVVSL